MNKCGICGGTPSEKSFPNCCFHIFCFECLDSFARRYKPICPTCSKRFTNIRRNVRWNKHLVPSGPRPSTSSENTSSSSSLPEELRRVLDMCNKMTAGFVQLTDRMSSTLAGCSHQSNSSERPITPVSLAIEISKIGEYADTATSSMLSIIARTSSAGAASNSNQSTSSTLNPSPTSTAATAGTTAENNTESDNEVEIVQIVARDERVHEVVELSSSDEEISALDDSKLVVRTWRA